MKVIVYGQSDDLIIVDGDISVEFFAYNCVKFLRFSDGSIVKVGYDIYVGKGWSVEMMKYGHNATNITLDPELEDGDHYTDRMSLIGDFSYVDCCDEIDGHSKDSLIDMLGGFEPRDYNLKTLRKVHAALRN